MFTFWDFALLYALVSGTVLGFFGYKYIVKPIINKIKSSRAVKGTSQVKTNVQNKEKIKTKEKKVLQEKPLQMENLFETGKNVFYTPENYDLVNNANSKYNKIKQKTEKLANELEITESTSKSKAKNLYKNKKKIIGLLNTQTNENTENLQCDYVKEENGDFNKRTYIQVFDDKLAKEFKKIAETETTEQEVGVPYVCELTFNEKSGKKPLKVSATNKSVLNKGFELLNEKVSNMISELGEDDAKDLFPLKINGRVGDEKILETCNSLEDFNTDVDEQASEEQEYKR